MIRARHILALALGVLGLTVAAVAIIGVISMLLDAFAWDRVLLLVFVLLWGLFGLQFLLLSSVRVEVTETGLHRHGIGGWQLKWREVEDLRVTSSGIEVEPTQAALRRQGIRQAARWSALFTPGRQPRDVIVLPQARIDAEASRVLETRLGSTG